MAISIRHVDDDASLVLAAQAGDTDAFSELFRRHYPSVRRVCARRLRDLREADEVAQAAFVRAYERIDQCEGERRFGPWVQVIAHRLCIDNVRARARTLPEQEPVSDDERIAPDPDTPEESLLRHERRLHLTTALQALPPRQRSVVIARDVEGRRPGEIAAALGLSIGAVDSLLLRARRRLASNFQAVSHDGGLATLNTAGSATAVLAGTTAAGPARIARVASQLGQFADTTFTQAATAAAHMPGVSRVAHDLAAAVVAGVLALVPMAGGNLDRTKAVPPPAASIEVPVRVDAISPAEPLEVPPVVSGTPVAPNRPGGAAPVAPVAPATPDVTNAAPPAPHPPSPEPPDGGTTPPLTPPSVILVPPDAFGEDGPPNVPLP